MSQSNTLELGDRQALAPEARGLRIRWLGVPFGLIGLGGGWVAGRALTLPPLSISRFGVAPVVAAVGGIVGVAAGSMLTWWLRRRTAGCNDRLRWLDLPVCLAGAGAVAGVVSHMWVDGDVMSASVGMGVAVGLCFVPLCLWVMAAALRAARARDGSLVAAADRRAAWLATAAVLSVTSLLTLEDWGRTTDRYLPAAIEAWQSAHVAWTMAAAALVSGIVLLILDYRAWRLAWRLLVSDDMEPGDDALVEDSPARTDLGLGDQVVTAAADAGSAYRHAQRTTAVIVGDVLAAEAALRRVLYRSIAAVVIAMGVTAWHGWLALGLRPGECLPVAGPLDARPALLLRQNKSSQYLRASFPLAARR